MAKIRLNTEFETYEHLKRLPQMGRENVWIPYIAFTICKHQKYSQNIKDSSHILGQVVDLSIKINFHPKFSKK